MFEIPTKRM